MKTYISGKITGLDKADFEQRFAAAEKELIEVGFEPVNPCKIAHDHDCTWESYMLCDIKALFECQAIYMLNNWRNSAGARIEHAIAIEKGMKVFYQAP